MHITGKNAKVYAGAAGATLVAGAHNWTLDYAGDTPESTDYASAGVKDFIAGNTGWSGTFDIKYDTAQDPHAAAGANINPNALLVLKLYLNATKYYTGSAYVTGVTCAAPQAESITYSVRFQGTGTLDCTNL